MSARASVDGGGSVVSLKKDDSLVSLPPGMVLRSYGPWVKYACCVLTIVTGAFSSVASKWQNRQTASRTSGGPLEPFEGALMQTLQMFIGESLAFPIWFIDDRIAKRNNKVPFLEFATDLSELQRKPTRFYWWPIASLHDCTATVIVMIAQRNASNATITMFRNSMVVMSAFAQMIYVRKALLLHEWLGIFLITLAMVSTAIPDVTAEDDENEFTAAQSALGIALTILGTAIQTSQLIYEEWVLRKGRYSPTKAVGMEGLSGMCYCFILWAPFQFSGLEDVTGSFYQTLTHKMVLLISFLYIPTACLFNIFGIATTKLGGGVLRGVAFSVRTPIVWGINMWAEWQTFNVWALMGAVIFVFGFFVYTSFIPASLWTKPIHMCCTNPAMDGVDPGHELKRKLHDTPAEEQDTPIVNHDVYNAETQPGQRVVQDSSSPV